MLDQLIYELQPKNIAAEPREVRLGSRDLGRLLIVDRERETLKDSRVLDLDLFLSPGDVLVLNDSKRLPGVLKTRHEDGGQVELRLVELTSETSCTARAYPTHALRSNMRLTTRNGDYLTIRTLNVGPHDLCSLSSERSISEILHQDGLPITSFFYRSYWQLSHYNPIYAKSEGSVESPLAGLHVTERLLHKLREKGVIIAYITLHVVGSWLPVLEGDFADQKVASEPYIIPVSTAEVVRKARISSRRVVALGSTTMRALESAACDKSIICPGPGVSNLFLKPGSRFKVVTSYFTNFHQARSSLMLLDAAFCGLKLVLETYRYAQREGYLFHEFGDAVLYI